MKQNFQSTTTAGVPFFQNSILASGVRCNMANSEIIGAGQDTARPAPKKYKLIPYKDNLCSRYAEKMLSIMLLGRCNRKCHFCVDRGGRKNNQINVSSISNAAISFRDYKKVIITGGEPFLVFDKVVELTRKLRPHKEQILLNTNGTLMDSEKVSTLNGIIDELQISIHHYDEKKNAAIFGGEIIRFKDIKNAIAEKRFMVSINSCLHNRYSKDEKRVAVDKLTNLCLYLGANNLRLTELKKVSDLDFAEAREFFEKSSPVLSYNLYELITKGCTHYYTDRGISVSVKRLCRYAKGEHAKAFSCCFIDTNGQKKIDVDTINTFKVIYGDGLVTDDWIFNPEESPVVGEESPAQNTMEICHTAPNTAMAKCQQVELGL